MGILREIMFLSVNFMTVTENTNTIILLLTTPCSVDMTLILLAMKTAVYSFVCLE